MIDQPGTGAATESTGGSSSVGSWLRLRGCVALLVLALPTTVLFVDETEHVIVERFGRIVAVYDQDAERGLHVKLPWPIDTARRFDRRLAVYEPPGREVFTGDRKNLLVETYVCWRIPASPASPAPPTAGDLMQTPVVKFYRALGDRTVAEARLGNQLQSILATKLGQLALSSLLRVDSDGPPDAATDAPLEKLAREVQQELTESAAARESLQQQWGIEITEVRIRRINFPGSNQQAVFERMRSERHKIAERYRSAGAAESRAIRSQAERLATEVLARTQAEADRIRAEAEGEALQTLQSAQARDPELAAFLQQLDVARQAFHSRTTLIVSGTGSLYRSLIDTLPLATSPAEPSPGPVPGAPQGPASESSPKQDAQP